MGCGSETQLGKTLNYIMMLVVIYFDMNSNNRDFCSKLEQ